MFAGRLVVKTEHGESKPVNDLLTGEVWLGSGQSNTNFKVASSGVAPATIAAAKEEAGSVKPALRCFAVSL